MAITRKFGGKYAESDRPPCLIQSKNSRTIPLYSTGRKEIVEMRGDGDRGGLQQKRRSIVISERKRIKKGSPWEWGKGRKEEKSKTQGFDKPNHQETKGLARGKGVAAVLHEPPLAWVLRTGTSWKGVSKENRGIGAKALQPRRLIRRTSCLSLNPGSSQSGAQTKRKK